VYETRVLRKIFGHARKRVTGDCKKLHNEELHDLNSTSHIIWMIESRRMSWVGHLKERDHLEPLGVGGRIILK
jgi:hypothetical protein